MSGKPFKFKAADHGGGAGPVGGCPPRGLRGACGNAAASAAACSPGSTSRRHSPAAGLGVEPAVDVEVQANEAPPPLPDYEQPPCPEDGYMWTPGYWAWGGGGYYWVPGTWVQPPRVGVLWTPGYWGFVGGVYAFHVGYWGPHIGYYGGVNYGFLGYVGVKPASWADDGWAIHLPTTGPSTT